MNGFQNWAFIPCMILASGAASPGQTTGAEHPPVTISGTVRYLSGAPSAGVSVTLYPGHYFEAPHAAEVLTDKNGRHEMHLQFHKPVSEEGFEGIEDLTNCILTRDLKRNLAAIQEFPGTPTNVDFPLQPGITLMGSVKDTKGAPVSNALVDLRFFPGDWERRVVPRLAKVDAKGVLSIPPWPPVQLGDMGDKVT